MEEVTTPVEQPVEAVQPTEAAALPTHASLLEDNTIALTDTINDITGKIASLKDAPAADLVELDRQVSQAHGILSAVQFRIKELLEVKDAA